jgi:ribosomal protein S18 acetylase RimI-like enzyme
VNVRRARPEDAPALVRLWREMWEYNQACDPRHAVTPLADRIMEAWIGENVRSERSCVLLAEDPGPVGYVTGMIVENPPVIPWQFSGFVSELAVTETARRKGIGAALLRELTAWFRGHRLPFVEVHVTVRNALARSFWRKNGYTEFLERLRMEL